jgi:hypothetical protein
MSGGYVDALEAVRSEFEYAENLERMIVKTKRPMEYIGLIEHICAEAKRSFYETAGDLDMSFMRKIAATAVRAMVENGTPKR